MQVGVYKGGRANSTDVMGEGHAVELGFSKYSLEELKELEDRACPGWGSCALLGTANSTQCLSEVAGLTLPGGGTAAAISAKRLWIAKESGRRIVQLVHEGIRASDILTREAIENMIIVLHAIGGSTNAVIHLLALIEELEMGEEINISTIDTWSDMIPCILNVQPSGVYSITEFDQAGGIQAVLKKLEPYLNKDTMTVNGRTLIENFRDAMIEDPNIIMDLKEPLYKNGLAVLKGNLATSAIVRPPVIPKTLLKVTGPARVFDSEEEALDALKTKSINAGCVIVVRYEGPRGAPGLRELLMLTYYLKAAGLNEVCPIVADGKFSGFAKGPFICQVTPEAAVGGVIAVVRNNDLIEIDIPNKILNVKLSDQEINKRLSQWKPKPPKIKAGYLTLYARMADSCAKGAGLPLKI
jgi:dihydroxy-acid dehydratase